MYKVKIFKIFFQALIFILLLGNGLLSVAEDQCSDGTGNPGFPTIIEDFSYSDVWFSNLVINLNKESLSRNTFAEAKLDSMDWGCPPFEWSVSGNGFHFKSKTGPNAISTYKDSEISQIWSDNTACGTATVTVKNQCNQTATASITSTYGTWVQGCFEICPDYIGTCGVHENYFRENNLWTLVYACRINGVRTGCTELCGANSWWITHQGDFQKVWRYDWQCQ